MLAEVVCAAEALVAEMARKGAVARVHAEVPRKLVGAAEAPVTPGPRARKRLVARVPPHVARKILLLLVLEMASWPSDTR